MRHPRNAAGAFGRRPELLVSCLETSPNRVLI